MINTAGTHSLLLYFESFGIGTTLIKKAPGSMSIMAFFLSFLYISNYEAA